MTNTVILQETDSKKMFSKTCEYGIRSAIYIAEQSLLDRKVSLKETANAIDSPEAFTSKILQHLSRSNIIRSDKGPTGGFSIDKKKLTDVRLCHIVSAIDGDDIYKGCGLGLSACNEKKPCPVHDRFKNVRDALKEMLETTSLQDLTPDLKNKLTFLRR